MTNGEFVTQDSIEETFETDHSFSKEDPGRSLGRLAWLTVRSRAELTLTLFDLGVEARQIPDIIEAVEEMQTDYYEFALVGLDRSRRDVRFSHPLEAVVAESVDDVIGAIREQDDDDEAGEEAGVAAALAASQLTDEDLLHKLEAHRKAIEADK